MSVYLRINGQIIYPSAGMSGLTLTLRNLDVDTLEFDKPLLNGLSQSSSYDYGSEVELWSDDTRVFVGTLLDSRVTCKGRVWRRSFRAEGPWRSLDRVVALQAWQVWDRDASTTQSVNKSRLLFGAIRESSDGDVTSVKTGYMLTRLMEQTENTLSARMQVGSIFGAALDDAADTGIYVPTWEDVDVTIAGAIKSILQWHPSAVSWWDYSMTQPALHIGLGQDLPVASASCTAADVVELDVRQRHDLVVPAVRIVYERAETVDYVTREYVTVDAAPVGTSAITEGALNWSVDWTDKDYAPPAFAAYLLAESSVLWSSGSITFAARSAGVDARSFVGHRLSITDGPSELGVPSLVTDVVYDVDAGRCKVSFGPPAHWTAAQWLSWLTRNKRAKATSLEQSIGTAVREPEGAADDQIRDLLAGFVSEATVKVYQDGVRTVQMLVKQSES